MNDIRVIRVKNNTLFIYINLWVKLRYNSLG